MRHITFTMAPSLIVDAAAYFATYCAEAALDLNFDHCTCRSSIEAWLRAKLIAKAADASHGLSRAASYW